MGHQNTHRTKYDYLNVNHFTPVSKYLFQCARIVYPNGSIIIFMRKKFNPDVSILIITCELSSFRVYFFCVWRNVFNYVGLT